MRLNQFRFEFNRVNFFYCVKACGCIESLLKYGTKEQMN